MPNTYFQFKQFTIHQDKAAMKVCTDACLFGAWVADNLPDQRKVLDIGTGTGLLSMMYAQKNPAAVIDAVEIDAAAVEQAQENFDASSFAERISLYRTAIQEFDPEAGYDLILSNPPFFEKDLRSPDPGRNKAMHDTSLTLEELGQAVIRLLAPEGVVTFLLPYHRSDYCTSIMNRQGLQRIAQVQVRQTPANNYFRSILCFSREVAANTEEQEITIKEAGNNYSPEFTNLLKDYYLYL